MISPSALAACPFGLLLAGCVTLPPRPLPLRPASADTTLVFEQRLARAGAHSPEPAWEAWQLYESGRLVYTRPASEPITRRVDAARLKAVHAWLSQHDFELVQSNAGPEGSAPADISGVCQVRLSTGPVVAALGQPRYYACDELKRLCFGR